MGYRMLRRPEPWHHGDLLRSGQGRFRGESPRINWIQGRMCHPLNVLGYFQVLEGICRPSFFFLFSSFLYPYWFLHSTADKLCTCSDLTCRVAGRAQSYVPVTISLVVLLLFGCFFLFFIHTFVGLIYNCSSLVLSFTYRCRSNGFSLDWANRFAYLFYRQSHAPCTTNTLINVQSL